MSHNTWVHRGVRIAMRPLVKTSITPNHLTTLRLALGFSAAGVLCLGDTFAQKTAALLFVGSFLLDRADGELARLSGKTSPEGHILDLWSDGLTNALVFVGLGVGLYGSPLGLWAPLMGLVAGVSVALILMMVMRMEDLKGARAGEIGSLGGFDPDDAILFVPLALWIGWSYELLWTAATVTPVFTIGFFLGFRKKLFAKDEQAEA